MSFWATSSGEKATGVVEDNNFDPVPKSWQTSLIEEMCIDEYQGDRKVKIKARIVGDNGYKNRVLFMNLKVFEASNTTEKQRDRAINLLTKMANIFKIPLPDREPDDIWLSKFIDKPIDLLVDVWEIDDKSGNWLVNAEAKGEKAGGAAAPAKAKPAARPAASKPASTPAQNFSDMDDDIPF